MNKKRILIVEDEKISAESLRKKIIHIGYEVVSIVSSGEEAVKKATELYPDIILMDINLSGKMDGIEASASIQANLDIPIIYITSYDDEKILQRALITSPYHYLVKPVNNTDLHNTIEIALNRYNLEKMFKEHEKWLEIILGNTTESVIILDTKGIISFMNSAAEKITGWKQEESIGEDKTKVLNIINKHTETSLESSILSALQYNITAKIPENTCIISRNGVKNIINGYAIPINDDTGIHTGTALLFRGLEEKNIESMDDNKNDLNKLILERTADLMKENVERQKVEESLQTSEEKYRKIVETAQEGIWLTDNNYKTTFVNQKMADMLGYSNQELAITQLPDYLEIEDRKHLMKEIKEKSGKSKDVKELLFKCKDGHNMWAIVSTNILFDDLGNRIGLLSMVTDITERKLTEKALIDAKLKAEESSRLKSILIMNLNHELRTPMNDILGFTSLLIDETTNSDQSYMLENIYFSGNRLMNTLNSIMEFALLESGETVPALSEFNIKEVLLSVIKDFEKTVHEKELSLIVNVEKNDILVKSDIDMTKTIISNIIGNAVKYTEKGGIKIELKNIPDDINSFVNLSISDTGIGIPVEKQKEIFTEFKQVSEGFGRNYEGMGLGLTIAKKMADLIGIQISMKSTFMKGSVFTLKIPSIYAGSDKIQMMEHPEFFEKTNNLFEYKQINEQKELLVIEDNIINIDLIIVFLKNIYHIDYALSGEKAIEMAARNKYSLILTDINLGTGINGIETQKRIRKINGYENIPNIAVTGYSTSEDKHQFLEEGFDGFIPKPFTRKVLINTIEKLIRKEK